MIIQPAHRLDAVQEYYFATKLREIESLKQQGKRILNLGIGSPDLSPPKNVMDAIATQSTIATNHGYQSYKGLLDLRIAFSGWYAEYFNVVLNPESEILPLMGSKEGIMHISMAFVNTGEGVLVPNPGYPAYRSVAKIVGANVLEYNLRPENNWLPDFDELENMNLDGIKLMWINYPNMPTGAKATHEVFSKIIAFAKHHRILVINDNPYSFILNSDPISLLSVDGAKDIGLELNSLSKSHNMAGWRMGMVAGNPDYIKHILTIKSNMDSGMFKPIQLAAVKALDSSREWYGMINKNYKIRQRLAFRIFDRLKISYDKSQVGMFVWGRIPLESNNSFGFSDHLLKEFDIFITPGSIFGSNGDRYVRISLCSKPEIFQDVLQRISAGKTIIKSEILCN